MQSNTSKTAKTAENGQTHRLPLQLRLEREQHRIITLHPAGQEKLE